MNIWTILIEMAVFALIPAALVGWLVTPVR